MKAAIGLIALLLTACGTTGQAAQPTPTAQSSPTPLIAATAEHGKVLFINKGCITCHVNSRAENGPRDFTLDGPPNLTNYRNDPAFLRRWLADPQAVRPDATMPNLNLTAAEIDALIAFLNEPQ